MRQLLCPAAWQGEVVFRMCAAGGKWATEREEGPREDTKWLFSAPKRPHHPGGPVARRTVPEDWRSHDNGLCLLRRTANLDPGNRQVLKSSITITFQDDDLVRVPAGFLEPPYGGGEATALLLGDSRHTPDRISILPEVLCFQPGYEVTISVMCHDPPYTLSKGLPFAVLSLLDSDNFTGLDKEENKYVFLTKNGHLQVGSGDRGNGSEPAEAKLRHIQSLMVHQYYDPAMTKNNIALLQLDQAVECSDYIQLGCVPDSSLAVPELKKCYIAGWRATPDSAPGLRLVLQEAKVRLIDVQLCKSSR